MRNFLASAIAFVFVFVALSQFALADQKKPKGETKPTTDPPIVKDTLNTGLLIGRTAPTKTGPTKPPKPTQGNVNR